MIFILLLMIVPLRREVEFAGGTKFNAETFSGISVLANQGKNHLDSITDKANVSRYGTCWKNAITELKVGCKSLSEDVQKDLALKLTDCFLQTSGYEPIKCEFPQISCLQNLSDRAFNAYTEFYTHTHSICYFLQSQIWQEEAEKTVNKLSSTSTKVSQQLAQSEKMQQSLLNHQKESLFLQHDLIENSKGIASTLKSSQENIQNMMNDFQTSTVEQRKLLVDVFDNLSSLRSWFINEMSWFSSSVFFVGATIVSFIFTSVPRTRGARIHVLLILILNFAFERFICSMSLDNLNSQVNLIIATDTLYTWIWLLRKFYIFLSAIIIIYSALSYHDYNILNYQLLLEIRNQNAQILKHFNRNSENWLSTSQSSKFNSLRTQYVTEQQKQNTGFRSPSLKMPSNLETSKASNLFMYSHKKSPEKSPFVPSIIHGRSSRGPGIDQIDNEMGIGLTIKDSGKKQPDYDEVSNLSEKSEGSKKSPVRSVYNLRSQRISKAPDV